MRLALPYPTMTFLSFYAAREQGFLAAEGVDLEILHVAGGGHAIMEMFMKGEVDFLFAHWEMVEIAMRGKLDVRALCGSIADPYSFFVRPEIKTFADLKGKNVMVGPMGSGSNTEARYCLMQAGVDPAEVNFVVGDYLKRILALQDPNIHAMQDRTQTWYWAQKAGWRYLKLADPDLFLDNGGLSTTLKLIREQPEIVGKVVKAVVQATRFIQEDREGAIALSRKVIPYLSDEEIRGSYEVLRPHFDAEVRPATIQFIQEAIGTVMGIPQRLDFEELVDLRFLRQAQAG
ncbi:MAG: ABC transporter substrate-binding protein [Deltaproteobacteria bacterium]|nr:ABC transporter substrate-binding protein [Deltaproteobacteria bacterium]